MPFRKTYHVRNQEEGKAAERDQSYRTCLITLLIFFFMCLILILACIPWKTRDHKEYENQYIEHEPQHHYGERTKETKTTSIVMTVLSTTLMTPKKITSIMNTEITEPTKNINIITEDYSKKNIKGSRYFERYSENRTTDDEIIMSPVTVSEKETEEFSTTKEIINYTEITENMKENIDLTTLPYNTVNDNINDNDAVSTLPNEPINENVSNASLNVTIDIIENITSSKSVQSMTEKYSPDIYYSTEKSQIDIEIDNITTSTFQLNEGYTANNFIDKYKRLEATTPNVPIDPEKSAKYFSDLYNYSEKSQFDVTTNNIITSTLPIQLNSEDDKNMKYSTTYLNYEESTINPKYSILINENVTKQNSSVTINYSPTIDEMFSTSKIRNESEDMTNSKITQKYNKNVTSSAIEEYNTSSNYSNTVIDFNNYMTNKISYDETPTTTVRIIFPDKDTNVCETGYCKQIASKMLSYMNHSADPCEDFYEYACGGFEANGLMDENLMQKSKNYQRIAKQMLKEKRKNKHSIFATYYDSCVQYEKNTNFNERAKMASDALKRIGEFYINTTWPKNYTGFTNLFAQLILHHSALLFDIVPELDEYHPNNFTLKIGPTTYESPFKSIEEDPCSGNDIEIEEHYVDLEILYNNYKKCKNNTKGFLRSIKEALTVLNVFKSLNNSYLELENIEKTIHVINTVLIQEYFLHFPSKSEIREAYVMKNYSKVSLEELQSSSSFINWTQLIHSLTKMNITSEANIQVYFYAALIKGLKGLEKFSKEDPIGLNNAIIGLYAYTFYHELVLPRRNNVKDHCLQVTIYLLQLEASSLYISSFTDNEIAQMDQTIKKIFNDLKQTLKLKTEEALWAREKGRQRLLKKIDSLALAPPVNFYFKDRDSLYSEYMSQIVPDNYFNNSMNLLKIYRSLIYAELKREIGEPKQIWTYYATPFESKAQAIYGLNLVVIPYGIIDWSLINNELSFDYILLATLGNLIAHQIAHHFDAHGIHYWDYIRNRDSLMYENEFTDTNFDDYINCQKENLYQEPMIMTLPFTDQTVSFMIPQLTLNERLSEIMGLRLAYDTLAMRSSTEKRLPWIKLRIDQLFYLAYAQTYCTRTPLTSSYISLHESEDLPSRIRLFVSASNNKLLAEAWKCPAGSKIAPIDVCSVFPYIDFKDTAVNLTPE